MNVQLAIRLYSAIAEVIGVSNLGSYSAEICLGAGLRHETSDRESSLGASSSARQNCQRQPAAFVRLRID